MFKGSNNILGILIRGTDYLTIRPRHHPIPPKSEVVFKDIKKMDKNNNYDYYFIVTEDNLIRKKFINEFKDKLKYIKTKNISIKYNYSQKVLLAFNKNIKGNIDYMKIYLINIIMLSRCIDIITARTNGSIGLFIFSNGFRNSLIYYLGQYK